MANAYTSLHEVKNCLAVVNYTYEAEQKNIWIELL